MVALCEVPRNAEGAQYEGRAHKGHPKSAASGRIKKACAPKDAQSPTLSLYLSSASPPISASTATRLCVGTVASPVRTTALSGRTDAPPTTLLR
jgi:hypothetical protein